MTLAPSLAAAMMPASRQIPSRRGLSLLETNRSELERGKYPLRRCVIPGWLRGLQISQYFDRGANARHMSREPSRRWALY